MEQGIKRTQRDYSLAFKLSVVAQVEKGDLTYKRQRRYGIQGRSTVLVWLRKHGLQDWSIHPVVRDQVPPCRSKIRSRSRLSSASRSWRRSCEAQEKLRCSRR